MTLGGSPLLHRLRWPLAAAACVLASLFAVPGLAPPAAAAPAGFVRVNQVGYAAGGAKEAFLLAKGPMVAKGTVAGATFAVVDSTGATAFTGPVGARLGSWNSRYPAVHLLDFTALKTAGTYHITVSGGPPPARPRSGSAPAGPSSGRWPATW
jgi:endoglucanase